MFSRNFLKLVAPATLLTLAGCSTTASRVSTAPSMSADAESASRASIRRVTASPVIRIYSSQSKRWVTFDEMINATSKADVVMTGEQHDDPVTHSFEVATIAALGDRRGGAIVSMEMFERDVQPLLDEYLSGAISEKEFLDSSRPWDRYATDYRPIVEIARVRGWPVVAANIPRRIASAVSKNGLTLLDTLGSTERSFAANTNSCPHDRYFELFTESMGNHGAGDGPASAVDVAAARVITQKFYEAQCTKDEAMGEAIASALVNGGRRVPVLHVNGSFHSDYALGTAARFKRRAPDAKLMVITAVPTSDLASADLQKYNGRGDFIVFTLTGVAKQ